MRLHLAPSAPPDMVFLPCGIVLNDITSPCKPPGRGALWRQVLRGRRHAFLGTNACRI